MCPFQGLVWSLGGCQSQWHGGFEVEVQGEVWILLPGSLADPVHPQRLEGREEILPYLTYLLAAGWGQRRFWQAVPGAKFWKGTDVADVAPKHGFPEGSQIH